MRALTPFMDDFGTLIVPGFWSHEQFMPRYYFFRGDL